MIALSLLHVASCRNAAKRSEVKRRFEERARREYVGQQQAWNFVGHAIDGYAGDAPRGTCADWVLHFSGPSGSGKSFLAEIIANAAFDTWEEEPYVEQALDGGALASCGALFGAKALLGPLGWGAAAAGCLGTYALASNSYTREMMHSYYKAPKLYPQQCGVRLHKFSRGAGVREVEEWEFRVAQELQRDPGAIIVVDDVGRLSDAAAFERFGQLLCGDGGNAIPEFRTGRGDAAQRIAAGGALFVLTSDLELDPSEPQLTCEVRSFELMLEAVRQQSRAFWRERNITTPDWWEQMPVVPFRELCADELSQAVAKYLLRECDAAAARMRAHLERARVTSRTAPVEYRWTGGVRHGPETLATLDNYVLEAVANSRMVGGRQGAWTLAEFHQSTMRPALQTLTAATPGGAGGGGDGGGDGGAAFVLSGGPVKRESSLLSTTQLGVNATTVTYGAQLCLEVTPDPSGGMPRVSFSRMAYMCS